jgi:hypothetical protein
MARDGVASRAGDGVETLAIGHGAHRLDPHSSDDEE